MSIFLLHFNYLVVIPTRACKALLFGNYRSHIFVLSSLTLLRVIELGWEIKLFENHCHILFEFHLL